MIPPYQGPALLKQVNIEIGNSEEYQLYNLKEDINQENNLAYTQPEKLEEMITKFKELRGDHQTSQKINLK